MKRGASGQGSAGAVRHRVQFLSLAVALAALQAGCGAGGEAGGGASGSATSSASGTATASAAAATPATSVATSLKAPGDGGGWDGTYADIAYLLAQGTWNMPGGTRPDFGFDSNGNIIAVWQFNCRVWASRMDAETGGWHGATMIDGGPGERWEPAASCLTAEPVIDVRPDGQALAVWVRTAGAADGNAEVVSARLNGGVWTAEPVNLGGISLSAVGRLAIATDGRGEASLAFVARNGAADDTSASGALFVATNQGAGWNGGRLDQGGIYPATEAYAPSLVADATGSLHLLSPSTYRIGPSSNQYQTFYRHKPVGGSWQALPVIVRPVSSYGTINAQLAVDASGRASAVVTSSYLNAGESERRHRVDLSTFPSTTGYGDLGLGSGLSDAAGAVPTYRYAVSPVSGRQWFVGQGLGGAASDRLEARHRLADAGEWSISELVPGGGGLSDLQIAVDGSDNLMVSYVTGTSGGLVGSVHARRWNAATLSWSADQIIWPGASDCTSGSHRLKADPAGRVVLMCGVAFYSSEGIGYTARSRRFEP